VWDLFLAIGLTSLAAVWELHVATAGYLCLFGPLTNNISTMIHRQPDLPSVRR